ncbi:hypothetical protein KY320_02970 [Candidatus Woesearchaeota archaeon]|nr:hypothetical protein [Candidatus Woesearchaeota archaeon]
MDCKSLLKPSSWKIFIFLILFVTTLIESSVIATGGRGPCGDGVLMTKKSLILLAPFSQNIYGLFCNRIVYFAVYMPYWYLISCLILLLYKNMKKEKSTP